MKTAEQIAEEIAAKANECCYRSDGYEEDMRARMLAALKEYGAAVRQRAAGVSRGVAEEHWPGLDAGASDKCAAAIERMELP